MFESLLTTLPPSISTYEVHLYCGFSLLILFRSKKYSKLIQGRYYSNFRYVPGCSKLFFLNDSYSVFVAFSIAELQGNSISTDYMHSCFINTMNYYPVLFTNSQNPALIPHTPLTYIPTSSRNSALIPHPPSY